MISQMSDSLDFSLHGVAERVWSRSQLPSGAVGGPTLNKSPAENKENFEQVSS